MTRSYGNFMFTFSREHQIVFYSFWVILHLYQHQCMRVSISPYPHQHFFFSVIVIHYRECKVIPHYGKTTSFK